MNFYGVSFKSWPAFSRNTGIGIERFQAETSGRAGANPAIILTIHGELHRANTILKRAPRRAEIRNGSDITTVVTIVICLKARIIHRARPSGFLIKGSL